MGSMIPELLIEAEEGCSTLEMDVHVDFAEDPFVALIDGRVVDGSLVMEGGNEALAQESIAGDHVHLNWAAGTADGSQVAVNGWLEQHRASADNRYRCFEGQASTATRQVAGPRDLVLGSLGRGSPAGG